MSRTSSEEQLNFLLSCVKHSNNGKVNFEAVATECEIVTKGAAAKRYERLLKANGINPNGRGPADDEASTPTENTTPKKPRKTAASKAGTPKEKEPKSANATPRKRRGGKAATAASPTKKAKSAEKIKEEDSGDEGEVSETATNGDNDGVKRKPKAGLRTNNDPFLAPAADKGSDEDESLQDFINTAKSAALKREDIETEV
ncbi:uncharacterized protein CIMG_06263 [Coccidioides immitis RS]|uniref:Myb-like DNA-binding domain-containing protein n=3 Tax=Coccidioides immitis TaxID=5501 RepID=J3K7S6_COCIM|nr:uncharacterized protein CIMG_06263 [Coccidioides immitis RS]EAS30784.3 hypothetical protein CIMG_06263 [Coccidioides immitis RS]KMP03365.1 hypothetical protein CIRG_03057 [Coccidioides immitis RMSCC 2394]KMU73904.1 hypothetical protein CISG_03882 [Coccidioides immitis RMSCC 3703]